MPIAIYKRGSSFHIRDTRGNHWTLRQATHGRDVRDVGDGSPIDPQVEILLREPTLSLKTERRRGRRSQAMSRFAGGSSSLWNSLPSVRGTAHGAMNLVTQEGSWAWYTGFGGRKRQQGHVQHGYVPRRTHTVAMNAATTTELGAARTATEYARQGHGAFWTRGHAAIRYEWCHLVSHGMGGPDQAANLVAATCHQNSEQLIIECVLYGYRMEGFGIDVEAKLARGTQHLAESIWYKVTLGGNTVYQRTMDARRATRPTWNEFREVAESVRASLNAALVVRYPADDLTYEQYEFIEEATETVDGDDGSAGSWRSIVGM